MAATQTASTTEVQPLTNSANFQWSLTSYESQGMLYLSWNTDAPFRAQQGQIHVYENQDFPVNPTDETKKWTWDFSGDHTNSPWNTGLPYGSNWLCAYIAQSPATGPYVYLIQLTTT
jgi:hypothetical protein